MLTGLEAENSTDRSKLSVFKTIIHKRILPTSESHKTVNFYLSYNVINIKAISNK